MSKSTTYRMGSAVIDTSKPVRDWEFTLADVYSVLATLPRYLGRSRRTVWEHSLAVAEKAHGLAWDSVVAPDTATRHRIASSAYVRGMNHDASEAFTGDIPGPMKHRMGAAYAMLEAEIQEKVYAMAGVSSERIINDLGSEALKIINDAVKQADQEDFEEEQRAFAAREAGDKVCDQIIEDQQQSEFAVEEGYLPSPPEGCVSSTPRPERTKFIAQDLFAAHADLCDEALRLMRRKNNDYAGSGGESPFKNFLLCGNLGVASTEAGIVIRMSDKLQRLAHAVSGQEMQVADESIHDTILDMINYSVILHSYLQAKEDGTL